MAARKKTKTISKEIKKDIAKVVKNKNNSSVYSKLMARVNLLSTKQKIIFLLCLGILALLIYFGYKFSVLAWVDSTPVTRFQLYQELDKKYGKDLREQLITETLIKNEAKKQGVVISQGELDIQIGKIEEQQGGKDKLDQILTLQGMTRQDLDTQIRYQLLIEKMFGKDIAVADNEIKDYIDKNKDQFPDFSDDESSESAKIKTGVADLLKRQKVGQSFNDWLKQALESPRIVRL